MVRHMSTRVAYRTCPLCEATCGLELELDGRRVKRIRGDRDDVFSHGFICPKGSTLEAAPRRPRPPAATARAPRRRASSRSTWDEAFAEVERGLPPILAEHGRDARRRSTSATRTRTTSPARSSSARCSKALGTKNLFSACTVDQMPKHVSSGLLFGNPLAIPVPDLDRTDYLLMLGANPLESNGSLCTAPDFPGRLEAIQPAAAASSWSTRGARRTAEEADEHLAIRPGTDAHLLLAIAHVLFADGLVDLGTLATHVAGLDEVRALVAAFTPEGVAPVTRHRRRRRSARSPTTRRRTDAPRSTAASAPTRSAFGTLASGLSTC